MWLNNMKFVALVSGGKDSCYNIFCAIKEGHELVAVANLHPADGDPEELDSYMFQTVGSKAIEELAGCLGVPLYRHTIGKSEDDVVQDISEVLTDVRRDFKDLGGVSVGAIASTYQQTRVDRACELTNLISLAYLWQQDQKQLLDDIIDSGLDVRIIKVAGIGLGERHLGKTLAECRADLLHLNELYGLHPCGEGGEYETMVFDGPIFRKRMVMVDPKVIKHGNGDVFYLSFGVTSEPGNEFQKSKYKRPELLEEKYEELLEDLGSVTPASESTLASMCTWRTPDSAIVISNARDFCISVSGTLATVFSKLTSIYSEYDIAVQQTVSVFVVLQSMETFTGMNTNYNRLYRFEGPPSRIAIEAAINEEVSVTAFGGKLDPEANGLHVRGRSFWAPANIGPYSQLRVSFGIAYLAGQIGLVPSILELHPTKEVQAVLALQHAFRILAAVTGDWKTCTCLVYVTDQTLVPFVNELWSRAIGHVPLVTALVNGLPRMAAVEWVLRAADSTYSKNHEPIDDYDDDKYCSSVSIVKDSTGYVCTSGFHFFRVSVLHLNDIRAIVFSNTAPSQPFLIHVPVNGVWYGGVPVDQVSVVHYDRR